MSFTWSSGTASVSFDHHGNGNPLSCRSFVAAIYKPMINKRDENVLEIYMVREMITLAINTAGVFKEQI